MVKKRSTVLGVVAAPARLTGTGRLLALLATAILGIPILGVPLLVLWAISHSG